jgi:hypothetical protein
MPAAAQGGSVNMLAWLLQLGCAASTHVASAAAAAGHMQALCFLRQRGCPWDPACWIGAARREDIGMMQYLLAGGCYWGDNTTANGPCAVAAAARHLKAVKFLHEHGCPWSDACTLAAAVNNDQCMLQWLHEYGCEWSEQACTAAARNANLNMLIYLRERGCPWEPRAVACAAAECGSVQIINWLRRKEQEQQQQQQQQEAVFTADTMRSAASTGQTALCELLCSLQCPCNSAACVSAARGGHVSTLRWLCEHGCPHHADSVCSAAAASGSVEAVEYAWQRAGAVTAGQKARLLVAMRDKVNGAAATAWVLKRMPRELRDLHRRGGYY